MVLPKTTTFMEAACKIRTHLTVHPFAFRVHTHELGRVVSGWRVTDDMAWSLVGKKVIFHLLSYFQVKLSYCLLYGFLALLSGTNWVLVSKSTLKLLVINLHFIEGSSN